MEKEERESQISDVGGMGRKLDEAEMDEDGLNMLTPGGGSSSWNTKNDCDSAPVNNFVTEVSQNWNHRKR